MWKSKPVNRGLDFSKKKKYGHLPVLDVTDGNISAQQIRDALSDKLESEEILDLILFREKYKEIINQVSRTLGRNKELTRIISFILRDYSSTNELRRMLLSDTTREDVLAVLSDLKNQSSFPAVRALEEKHITNGNSLPLFVSDCDQINCFCKNQTRLNQYLVSRKKQYPEMKFRLKNGTDKLSKKESNILNNIHEEMMFRHYILVQNFIDKIISNLQIDFPEVGIIKNYSTVKVKSKESILRKLQEKGYYFADMTDILRGRIIVKNLKDMATLAEIIEEELRPQILEKDNKFIDPNHRAAYRAIHYIIKINNQICFELQIKTFNELILSEMDHDVVKNDKYKLSDTVKQKLTAYYWGLQKKLLLEYIKSP